MMNRVRLIILLTSLVAMLLGSFVVHHHHDGVICVVIEICQSDHAPNDEHTSHHEDGCVCPEKGDFVADHEHLCKSAMNIAATAVLSCFVVIVDKADAADTCPLERNITYRGPLPGGPTPLRAPPVA